jgi:hypothetical protein
MTYRPGPILLEAKHPREQVDYAIPLARWLVDDETIAIGDVEIDVQTGITLTPAGRPAPSLTAGYDLVFWLGGGTDGATYQIEILVVTSGGRHLVVSCLIEVVDPTPAVPEA